MGAEWVRAPIEMNSTPVSAISRTFSRVDPARGLERDAVGSAGVLVAQRDRFAQRLGAHVVEQQAVDAHAERVGGLVEVADLDLDRHLRLGVARRVDRLRQAAGERRCGSP